MASIDISAHESKARNYRTCARSSTIVHSRLTLIVLQLPSRRLQQTAAGRSRSVPQISCSGSMQRSRQLYILCGNFMKVERSELEIDRFR